jgi:pyruvate,water dikinase
MKDRDSMLAMADLRSPEANEVARFGGKAAGLARLVAGGARVPEGFAVEATRLEPGRWPRELREAFRARAESLLGDTPVVVRSSAPEEDGAQRSYAGIFETVLGVSSATDALEAAGHCIASGDAPRLHAYSGPGEALAVGLVVQRQVGARCAGVCFTLDPTGGEDAVVIEAVSGLGDQLVSGQAQPESWRIDPARRQLLARRMAGGDEEILSEAEALEIAREARELASRLGEPLDLEWARDAEGQLWWLQARPITALADPSVRAVERSSPDAEDGPVTVWANFNFRETMPDPLPPLVWSLWRDRLLLTLLQGFLPSDLPPKLREKFVCIDRVGGRIYWNLNAVLAVPIFGSTLVRHASEIDATAGERIEALRGTGLLTPRRIPGAWRLPARVLLETIANWRRIPRRPERALEELEALGARLRWRSRHSLGDLTSPELLGEIRALTDPAFLALHRFVPAALGTGFAFMAAQRIFRRHPEAAQRLAVGIRGNPTTEMSLALDALVEHARPLAEAFAEARPAVELLDRLSESAEGQAFLAAFDAFLEQNGQRAAKEFDLSVPRWREQPDFLLGLIRATLLDPAKESLQTRFARLREERRTAIDAAVASSARPLRPLMRFFERAVERGMPLREAPKHYGLEAFARVREIVLELGSRLAAQGTIAARDDVFYLDWRELEAYLAGAGEAPDWQPRIEARKDALARFAAEPADAFVRSDGLPVPGEPVRAQEPDGALRGAGLGTGRVTGPVRILDTPDPRALHEGEVLVVRFADPGWTPLFPRAAALVMEVGGVMCHAAVVARELGIPAVFGVRGATDLLENGCRVTVDGVSGTVTPARPEADAG